MDAFFIVIQFESISINISTLIFMNFRNTISIIYDVLNMYGLGVKVCNHSISMRGYIIELSRYGAEMHFPMKALKIEQKEITLLPKMENCQ